MTVASKQGYFTLTFTRFTEVHKGLMGWSLVCCDVILAILLFDKLYTVFLIDAVYLAFHTCIHPLMQS